MTKKQLEKELSKAYITIMRRNSATNRWEIRVMKNTCFPETGEKADWLVALFFRQGQKVGSVILFEELSKEEALKRKKVLDEFIEKI